MDVTLRRSPSSVVGGSGRFDSGGKRDRWRTRGVFAGVRVSVPGARSEVLEALREGGPTNSAGAGRRFVCVLVVFVLLSADAIVIHSSRSSCWCCSLLLPEVDMTKASLRSYQMDVHITLNPKD